MTSFLKRKNLLTKHTSKNVAKKPFLLTRNFLALIIFANFFVLCFYVSLWFVMKYIIFLYLIAQDLSNKKKAKKSVEEIKKELLESIVKERSEELELIKKHDCVLTLQDVLECVKQYE